MRSSILTHVRRCDARTATRAARPYPLALAFLAIAAAGCSGGGAPGGPDDDVTSASTSVTTSPRAEVLTSSLDATASLLPAGWEAPPPPSTRPGVDLAALVPNNALVYLELRSIDALEEAIRRFSAIAALSEQGTWRPFDAMLPLSNAGVDLSRVDRSAPFAIALAPVPGEFIPGLVLIVPALGDEPIVHSVAAMKSRRMNAMRVNGGYVVLQHDQMPTGDDHMGSARITEDIPPGLVRGRVIVSAVRPIIAPYVRAFATNLNEQYRLSRPRVSDRDLKKLDSEATLDLLDHSREIAFGFELVQDQVDLELRFVECDRIAERRARGQLGVDIDARVLEELSHHVEVDDAVSLVFAFDRETMLDDFQGSVDDLQSSELIRRGRDDDPPAFMEEQEEGQETADEDKRRAPEFDETALRTIEKAIARMLESFEPAAAVSMSLEPAKAHLAIYFLTLDPIRAREAISLLLSKCDLDTWGFEMALPIRSRIDGVLVEDYSVRFDNRRIDFDRRAAMREAFKTFLGDSTLHVKVATSDDHVLLLLGGDSAAVKQRIRAFDSESASHPTIAKAVDRATQGEAATIAHTDLVELLSQIAGLAAVAAGESVSYTNREIMRQVGSEPAEFTFWSSVDGNDQLFGTTFDLSELARVFEAFKGSGL